MKKYNISPGNVNLFLRWRYVYDKMTTMENMNNVNGNSIRKRRKNRRLLVRVGITVFVVFSLLIVLLGFLIVHTASSSFFSGQQDTLRAQLMK